MTNANWTLTTATGWALSGSAATRKDRSDANGSAAIRAWRLTRPAIASPFSARPDSNPPGAAGAPVSISCFQPLTLAETIKFIQIGFSLDLIKLIFLVTKLISNSNS